MGKIQNNYVHFFVHSNKGVCPITTLYQCVNNVFHCQISCEPNAFNMYFSTQPEKHYVRSKAACPLGV